MSHSQNIGAGFLRVDYSRADLYIQPEPRKLNFFQKLGRFTGKTMSFFGPIGAAVAAVALPGIGLPIAAGIYGLSRFSQDQLYRSSVKDQIAMAHQPQPQNVQLPGLFETAPIQAGQAATDFIVPNDMEPKLEGVIIQRQGAQQAELQSF